MSSTCWRCQSALNDGARFCSNCGVRVSATTTSAAGSVASDAGSPVVATDATSNDGSTAPLASAFPGLGEADYDASDDPSTNEVAIVATPPARPGGLIPPRADEALPVHEDTTSPVSAIPRHSESVAPSEPRLDGLVSEAAGTATSDSAPATSEPPAPANDAAADSPQAPTPAAGRSNGSPWYSVVLTDDEPSATSAAVDAGNTAGADAAAPGADAASEASTATASADPSLTLGSADPSLTAGSADPATPASDVVSGTERFAPVTGDSVRPWGSAPAAPLTPADDGPLSGLSGTSSVGGEVPSVEIPSSEAPSSEAPSSEIPSSEAPSNEALSSGALSNDAPTVEIPAAEFTSSDAPAFESGSLGAGMLHSGDLEGATPEQSTPEVPAADTPTIEVPAVEGPADGLGSAALSSVGLPFTDDESVPPGASAGSGPVEAGGASDRDSGAAFAGGAALGGLAGAGAERTGLFNRSSQDRANAQSDDLASSGAGASSLPPFGNLPNAQEPSTGASAGLSAGGVTGPVTAPVTAASPIPPVAWSDPVPSATAAAEPQASKKRKSGGAGFGGLLVLLGGVAMIVGSFLPWAKAALGGQVTELKGFQNAVGDPWGGYGTASIGGLLVLLAFGYFAGRRRGRVSLFVKMLVFLASLGGVGFMVYLLVDLAGQTVKATAQIGMWLALGGAIVAFLGSLFGRTSKRKAAQAEALRTGGTVNSGGIPPQQPYRG